MRKKQKKRVVAKAIAHKTPVIRTAPVIDGDPNKEQMKSGIQVLSNTRTPVSSTSQDPLRFAVHLGRITGAA